MEKEDLSKHYEDVQQMSAYQEYSNWYHVLLLLMEHCLQLVIDASHLYSQAFIYKLDFSVVGYVCDEMKSDSRETHRLSFFISPQTFALDEKSSIHQLLLKKIDIVQIRRALCNTTVYLCN
jgi:hypothetical protein